MNGRSSTDRTAARTALFEEVLRELESRSDRVNSAFETARRLLSEHTAEAGEQARAALRPILGQTTTISEFQQLAELLSRAYVLCGNLHLARTWLQYAPAKPGRADVKVLAEVCFEMGDFEAAASYYREYVRQFE